MTVVDQWKPVLSEPGMNYLFSPSGHAVAFQNLYNQPFMQGIEICFADGRELLHITYDYWITPLAWASDTELVFRKWEEPGSGMPAEIGVLSVGRNESRLLTQAVELMSVQWAGTPGHLSVLAKPKGVAGLFDFDVQTGTFQRIPGFDAALNQLEVYPLFGHSFCPTRQEVVFVAWEWGDYLPEGAEPERKNSPWLEARLNDPAIQNIVEIQPDGTSITQRELTEQSKRKTHHHLFLLNASGGFRKIPGTQKAHRPLWSPDGTLLSFQRHDHVDPLHNPESCGSVWVAQRDDLSQMRLGGCGVSARAIMHPSGVLLCQMEDERISGGARAQSREWKGFVLRNGEVKPE